MNFLKHFPEPSELLAKYPEIIDVPAVNAHLHTPWSFSSFNSVDQIFSMAKNEQIQVLGINDFFTTEGYDQFYKNSIANNTFPLFNVEFIGLLPEMQKDEVRINDPGNPGRIYFSGKGLNYPFIVNTENQSFLYNLIDESQKQMKEMIAKVNELFMHLDGSLLLNYDIVKAQFARELVRERHIAKAIRKVVCEKYADLNDRTNFFSKLFGGVAVSSNMTDEAALEDEIRSRLLKKGGSAFIPEDESSFPPLKKIISFILDAGGIPCYPVLLDDKNGKYTQFEENWDEMYAILKSLNVGCIELIPSRNSIENTTNFVRFFNEKGFIIMLGSEHNTPGIFPLEVKIEKNQSLSDELKLVSYQGSCVVAAHQYLSAKGKDAFVSQDGTPRTSEKAYFVKLGNAVISQFLNK